MKAPWHSSPPATDDGPTVYRGERLPPPLRPWLGQAQGLSWLDAAPAQIDLGETETVQGVGLLAERERHYRVDYGADAIALCIDTELRCRIDADGAGVDLIDGAQASVECLLGPPLVLALARRGRHCLHAAAALSPDRQAVLFSAASGTGKSTLAATAQDLGWQRLSDDICPIDAAGRLRPRFPQLKLDPQQPPRPEHVALDRLVLLRRAAQPALRSLSVAETAKALLAASVGARLYSAAMRSAHFRWATELASRLGQGGAWELTLADQPKQPQAAVRAGLALLLERWS